MQAIGDRRRRERDLEPRAVELGQRGHRDGRAVRVGDRVDDRQAKAGAARAGVAAAAHEALEHATLELGRDAGTVVLDHERGPAVADPGGGADVRARWGVAERVLEQVEDQPVQVVADALDHRRLGIERDLVILDARSELGGGVGETLGEVGRTPRLQAADVGARQQQQVGDEPAHAARRAQRRLRRFGLLAVEFVGQQLEVGQHARQRRAQLVRGVGDELALARERRLALGAGRVQRPEHRFERARQLGDLVLGLGVGDAQRRVARALDLTRCLCQLDDRTHRALGDEQAREHRQDRAAEHAATEEDPHLADRLVEVGQRLRVNEQARAVWLHADRHRLPDDLVAVLDVGLVCSGSAPGSAGRSAARDLDVCEEQSSLPSQARRSGSARGRLSRSCRSVTGSDGRRSAAVGLSSPAICWIAPYCCW